MSVKSGAVALAGAVCGAYLITHKHDLKFYHYEIVNTKIPEEFDGFRILHLSDLHSKEYGREGQYLAEACAEFNPDAIVFTGDLFSRNESIFTVKRKVPLMKRLNSIAPVYYVWGNHEADVPDKALLMNSRLADEGITVLRNEKVRIYSGESYINIYGLELSESCYKNPSGGYDNLTPVTLDMMNGLLGKPDEKDFNVLLAHTPMPFETYARWGADFTLSGHVHGGIIRLPGGIGLLSPERKFFPTFTKGLYLCETDSGKALMEVSTGLGKFRINNPEMVSLCILRRHSTNDGE
jgi:hypothetical protein